MALSLSTYPHWRTTLELRREIGCGRLVRDAVRALVGIGLIERRGVAIRPTLAAAHFERLELP